MKIKLSDNVFLNCDNLNFWITEEHLKTVKDRKTKEVTEKLVEERITGYHRHMDDLLISFLNSRVQPEEGDTLQDILFKITEAKEEIRSYKYLITLDDMKKIEKPEEKEWEEEL